MPFTPFHFGSGFLGKAIAPHRFRLSSFVLANVLIDTEVLYYISIGHAPIHRHFHTYIGGVVAGIAASAISFIGILAILRLTPRSTFSWDQARSESKLQLAGDCLTAGILGGVSHIVLDSVMHHEMHPFWPFIAGNTLAGSIGVVTLHMALALVGFLGLALWLFTSRSESD